MIAENVGGCITPESIAELFEAIEAIEQCALNLDGQFSCKQFVGTATGGVNGEACTTVFENTRTSNPNDSEVVQKMVLFTSKSSSTYNTFAGGGVMDNVEEAGIDQITESSAFTITCGGESSGVDLSCNGISAGFFECESQDTITICARNTAAHPSIPNITGVKSIEFCGAIVCISTATVNAIRGVFKPPINPACCFGRESLHLALQNLFALRSALSGFGQIPACQSFDFADPDDHVLLPDALAKTDFLLVGYVEICAINNSAAFSSQINASVSVSCGGQSLPCLSQSETIPAAEKGGFNPSSACLRVPVVSCGTCEVGDSLIVGSRRQVICSELPSQVVGNDTTVLSVEQHFCVYTFESLQNDFGDGLNRTIGRCITAQVPQQINQSLALLEGVCATTMPINLTTRRQADASKGTSATLLIQEALPWPPAAPLPRPVPDPPPIKKWFASAKVRAATTAANFGGDLFLDAILTVSITCGGAVVATNSIRWDVVRNSTYDRERTICVDSCVECPIDQPLEATFSIQTIGNVTRPEVVPDNLTYEATAFCF